jgi:ABC-2 type transport system permease protein
MIYDISTVMWKELREFFYSRGGRKGLFTLLVPVFLLGVYFPLQFGTAWASSLITMVMASWVTLFITMAMIADSFAGERERHTLETLLASRLPDSAIFLGKLLAAVAYAEAIVIATSVSGMITVSIKAGQCVLMTPLFAGTGLAFSILAGVLIGGIGVLVSLRAATVRQAQQVLSTGVLILAFLPSMLVMAVPHDRLKPLLGLIDDLDTSLLIAGAFLVLGLADIIFIVLAGRRFRRDRLLLD